MAPLPVMFQEELEAGYAKSQGLRWIGEVAGNHFYEEIGQETEAPAEAPPLHAAGAQMHGSSVQTKKATLQRALATHLMQFTKGFTRWDRDKNGYIDRQEFRVAMRELKLPCSDDATCDLVFDEFDFDQSEKVTYTECLRYTLLDILQTSVTRIYNIFKLWDVDKSGTINVDEFRDAVRTLGIDAPRLAIDALFHELDEDLSGELDYEEFRLTLKRPRGHIARSIAEATMAPAAPSSPPAFAPRSALKQASLAAMAASRITLSSALAGGPAGVATAPITSPQKKRVALRPSSHPAGPSSASDDEEDGGEGWRAGVADAGEDPLLLAARVREAALKEARAQSHRRVLDRDPATRRAALEAHIRARQEHALLARRRHLYTVPRGDGIMQRIARAPPRGVLDPLGPQRPHSPLSALSTLSPPSCRAQSAPPLAKPVARLFATSTPSTPRTPAPPQLSPSSSPRPRLARAVRPATAR